MYILSMTFWLYAHVNYSAETTVRKREYTTYNICGWKEKSGIMRSMVLETKNWRLAAQYCYTIPDAKKICRRSQPLSGQVLTESTTPLEKKGHICSRSQTDRVWPEHLQVTVLRNFTPDSDSISIIPGPRPRSCASSEDFLSADDDNLRHTRRLFRFLNCRTFHSQCTYYLCFSVPQLFRMRICFCQPLVQFYLVFLFLVSRDDASDACDRVRAEPRNRQVCLARKDNNHADTLRWMSDEK